MSDAKYQPSVPVRYHHHQFFSYISFALYTGELVRARWEISLFKFFFTSLSFLHSDHSTILGSWRITCGLVAETVFLSAFCRPNSGYKRASFCLPLLSSLLLSFFLIMKLGSIIHTVLLFRITHISSSSVSACEPPPPSSILTDAINHRTGTVWRRCL